MATWPSTEELARVLNVEGTDPDDPLYADTLPRVRASAIDYVKLKRGAWVEGTDAPDEMLAQAALRMAEMLSLRPQATPAELDGDPTFNRLMYGHRKRFGIA